MNPARKRLTFVVASLVAVYLVWGSTYLALAFGLEGFPPFILNGIRFLVAGAIVFGYGVSKGIELPTPKDWWNAGRIGVLMLVGGVGLVTIAEDVGVGSGLAATAVAVMPLWAAVISGFFGSWPRRMEWFGLGVGFAGVAILAAEGDFQATRIGAMLMIIAPVFWAFGSVWGKRLRLPSATMTTAAQLLVAGVVLLMLGPVRGERIDAVPGIGAWLALGYLIVFGSVVAYTAYVYLLKEVRPALATSYAYVNPVVAVVLGITLGGEILTGPAYVALPLILSGVALVTLGSRRPPTAASNGGVKVSSEAVR
ncbi:MAG: drug/metabolite exporter YedA [Acidimicrobiia bacterium]|nr:MAG: drug/metabolite exporter YedA [Acidimicrobiia bacterium]